MSDTSGEDGGLREEGVPSDLTSTFSSPEVLSVEIFSDLSTAGSGSSKAAEAEESGDKLLMMSE